MDYDKQKDEITALESIYNEEEFVYYEKNGQFNCTFKIFINLPENWHLIYKDYEINSMQKVQISYLPPLTLHVTLPEDYPSVSAPTFTLCSSWLNLLSLSKLCKKLDLLWNNNIQEILFIWIEFLQNEALNFLKIKDYLNMDYIYMSYKKTLEKLQDSKVNKDTNECNKQCNNEAGSEESAVLKKTNVIDKRAILDCPIGRNPIQVLIDYNERQKQIEFKKNFYTCSICFTAKSGEHCTQFLPCAHTFCKDCIRNYFEIRIKEGSVQNICCPEENCKFEATPNQIKNLVSSELFSKYDSLLLNIMLDVMDTIYCPRRHCQYPVTIEPNDTMAECPVCQYAFCVRCRMVYHGIEPCKITSMEKQRLLDEYQLANIEKKAEMEQRYGKKYLQMIMENIMSENWINDNSRNCPHCKVAIEKLDGCNKMTCSHCGTYFCWLCHSRLKSDSPYLHFRDPNSKCFNMLYHGAIPDEPDDELYYELDDELYDQINLEFRHYFNDSDISDEEE